MSIAIHNAPACAVPPGTVINLRGDLEFDAEGANPVFANDLHVHEAYAGPPNPCHMSGLLRLELQSAEEAEEGEGLTLFVSEPDGIVTVLYFKDDRREVRFGFPDEDEAQ